MTPGVLERLQLITDNFERSRALLELTAEASKSTELSELLLRTPGRGTRFPDVADREEPLTSRPVADRGDQGDRAALRRR